MQFWGSAEEDVKIAHMAHLRNVGRNLVEKYGKILPQVPP